MDIKKRWFNKGVFMDMSIGEVSIVHTGLDLLAQDPTGELYRQPVAFTASDVNTLRDGFVVGRNVWELPAAHSRDAFEDNYTHRTSIPLNHVGMVAAACVKAEHYFADQARAAENSDLAQFRLNQMKSEYAGHAATALLPHAVLDPRHVAA